jgi:hypothetical protein
MNYHTAEHNPKQSEWLHNSNSMHVILLTALKKMDLPLSSGIKREGHLFCGIQLIDLLLICGPHSETLCFDNNKLAMDKSKTKKIVELM